jgi:putative phosphoribosyl transferase
MGEILDNIQLREKRFVFHDRHDAGKQLGAFIRDLPGIVDPVVLAIPAGGVPVGTMLARALAAPLGLAIVRKIRIPGSTEAGFGAVTWDGEVLINERLRAGLGLRRDQVDSAVAATRENVQERVQKFSRFRHIPELAGKTVILTDDGLASGFTMLAAIRSIRAKKPHRIIIAVPTGSSSSIELVRREADLLVCLNIRSSGYFAVAEAYEQWYDLDDQEVIDELKEIS